MWMWCDRKTFLSIVNTLEAIMQITRFKIMVEQGSVLYGRR